ncbi:MAG: transporter related protein, partial [Dehalococcoidia bacterium]|nr:transporter related protein [Dehalococcoidia bacterium]
MAIIKTEKLTKAFGRLVAVNELSLEVEPGEVFGLLGPNGAGKTTAIRMLITLLRPTAGKAWVGGLDVRKSPLAVRRLIGYVPQAVSADSDLSGYENLLI